MKNNKLQNGIGEIKNVNLTLEEKKRIFSVIINSETKINSSIKSPWSESLFFTYFQKNKFIYLIIPLIIILSGGSLAFASEESLPNNFLYPIKTDVIEPLREALTFSAKGKALYQSNLATKRLVEAETLIDQGKLDQDVEIKINRLLEKHIASLDQALAKVKIDPNDGQDEIKTNFRAGMKAHVRVMKMLQQEDKTIDSPVIETQISETVRKNTDKIKENRDSKNEDKLKKYNQRKKDVEALINQAVTDINDNSPEANQKIITDTNQTLDEAKNFLKEADGYEKDGDLEGAYQTLLDSESSVKEAGIFFKAGMKFKNKHNK